MASSLFPDGALVLVTLNGFKASLAIIVESLFSRSPLGAYPISADLCIQFCALK